jgi:hypothetical protein
MKTATTNPDATELLGRLKAAVAVANDAERRATTARDEHISRSKAVGILLLEARKLHPAVKDFEAFLRNVDGLKLSRAYDLMRLAGGRTTEEEIRKETRDRVKKHRGKNLPKPEPKKPEPSVTSPPVTESPKHKPAEQTVFDTPQEAHGQSARALREFTYACRTWPPKITAIADRKQALLLLRDVIQILEAKEAA